MGAMATDALTVGKSTIISKEDHSLVETLVFQQVVPSLLRICLEYGVHFRGVEQNNQKCDSKLDGNSECEIKVNESIRYFIENEKLERPLGWFAENSSYYRKSYMKLDTTSLIEIIPRVTDIKHDNKDESFIQLFKSLREIKYLRNKVIHENEVAFCEDKINLISEKISSVVVQLGKLFGISDKDLDRINKHFEKEIEEIMAEGNQKTNEDKLIGKIKQSLLEEIPEKWAQIVTKTMKTLTLSDNRLQVCLSDMFYETDFEVLSDFNNLGSLDPQDRKSFPCTDIMSSTNFANIDIIEGDPGSGKSTFLKKVCLEFCKNLESNADVQFKSISSYDLMFHFNCQETLNVNSFWQLFKAMFRGTAENFPEQWVMKALRDMKIIVAVDGIDACNTTSEELVKDTVQNFSDCETVKFLITTRPGFSNKVINQFHSQAIKPRVLNIKPIIDIKEQKIFIHRVIKQLPEINAEELLLAYNESKAELHANFVRPIDLILFITLFHCCSDEIQKVSQKLDLMRLTFKMMSKNISLKLSTVENFSTRTSWIMEMIGRYSLQWIQNKTYEFDETIFDDQAYEIFNKLGFANDGVDEVSVDDLLRCVFQQQERATRYTKTFSFFHHSLQEYFASRVLTEKLVDNTLDLTQNRSLKLILQELTGQEVQKEDFYR